MAVDIQAQLNLMKVNNVEHLASNGKQPTVDVTSVETITA